MLIEHIAKFRCPKCRSALEADGPSWCCTTCGAQTAVLASNFIRFGVPSVGPAGLSRCETNAVHRILGWTDELARCVESDLASTNEGPVLTERTSEEFRSLGLLDQAGNPTPDGAALLYHFRELAWQKQYDVLEGQVDLETFGPCAKVLDIGGGAGQTLGLLSLQSTTWKVALDVGLIPLAVGARLAELRDGRMDFCAASAHNLPFADGLFQFVMLRGSLNYIHQSTAISEATRVLAPGGLLFCRTESLWWDLNVLRGQTTVKGALCRMRDLGIGSYLALTGRQPVPGSTVRGGRAYSTRLNLQRKLGGHGCSIVRMEDSMHGPRFRGRPTQFLAVARKEW